MDISHTAALSTGHDTPSRKRSQECEAGPSRQVHLESSHGKRPRLTPEEDAQEHFISQTTADQAHIPDAALLYHYAVSAHHASNHHLQQAFIPSWIQTRLSGEYDPIPLYSAASKNPRILATDQQAAGKAFALQLLALDLLAVGLKRNDLSDSERAAFTIELVIVGIKVMGVKRYTSRKGKGGMLAGEVKVDMERLVEDIHGALAAAIAICERNTQLVLARQRLEWLNIRLLLMENRVHNAKRIARQYLARCTKSDATHRYAIQFLLMDRAASSDPGEALSIIDEISVEALSLGHRQILQILSLARCRLLFAYRRWDAISSALQQMANLLQWDEESYTSAKLSTESSVWHTVYTAHYLMFRSLWEGRIGQDKLARNLLKRLYLLMDEAVESGQLEELRASGGVLQLDGLDPPLFIQTTPPNVLYRLTFLATVASRRDFIGPAPSCKTLIHIRAMREYEQIARKDDIWDTGFASQHGLADVWLAQEGVIMGLAEIMMEEATAWIVRSDFVTADKILNDFADFAHTHDILDILGPHLCLVQAMMAQLLGHEIAEEYYRAALSLLEDGSELGLMIEASLLGAQGKLQGVKMDHTRQTEIKDLAAKCRLSSSMALNTIGQLLSALADDNLMSSKKKIGGAYDMCQSSNNNLLRALVFAFTSTTHLTGSEDRVQKQLETGLDIATLLGGKDRPDQVGQPVLGLWFAVRLRRQHHRNQRTLEVGIARSKILRYTVRLDEIMEFSRKKYEGSSSLGWLGQEVE